MKVFNEILNMEEVTGIWIVPIWRDNPYDYTKEKNDDEMVINILINDTVSSERLAGELWDGFTDRIMRVVENADIDIPVITLDRNRSGVIETLCDNKDLTVEWVDELRKQEARHAERRKKIKGLKVGE